MSDPAPLGEFNISFTHVFSCSFRAHQRRAFNSSAMDLAQRRKDFIPHHCPFAVSAPKIGVSSGIVRFLQLL